MSTVILVPYYPEHAENLTDALFAVAPTFVFTVPRYLQKIASRLLAGLKGERS